MQHNWQSRLLPEKQLLCSTDCHWLLLELEAPSEVAPSSLKRKNNYLLNPIVGCSALNCWTLQGRSTRCILSCDTIWRVLQSECHNRFPLQSWSLWLGKLSTRCPLISYPTPWKLFRPECRYRTNESFWKYWWALPLATRSLKCCTTFLRAFPGSILQQCTRQVPLKCLKIEMTLKQTDNDIIESDKNLIMILRFLRPELFQRTVGSSSFHRASWSILSWRELCNWKSSREIHSTTWQNYQLSIQWFGVSYFIQSSLNVDWLVGSNLFKKKYDFQYFTICTNEGPDCLTFSWTQAIFKVLASFSILFVQTWRRDVDRDTDET